MGSFDRVDERTFKVNFTGKGAAKLRNTVDEKLKEFMGDYTDETLVEYVVVLLRNGRNKEEARNELDVFLGDDSDSFVSWLWDHLASSLYLYTQAEEPGVDELMPILELDGNLSLNIGAGSEKERSSNLSISHHNGEDREPAGYADEPLPILKSEVQEVNAEERRNRRVERAKRAGSPRRPVQKKRIRADERRQMKELGLTDIDVPRHLLHFAVQDAVGRPRSDYETDSSVKRLRSVVSTSFIDIPQFDRPQRRGPNFMATVIRAVAESDEDTRRSKTPGSVFDRLGRGAEVMEPKFSEHWDAAVDDEDYVGFNHIPMRQTSYTEKHCHGDMTMMEREPELVSGYHPSAINKYGEVSVRRQNIVCQIATAAGNRGGYSPMLQHNVENKSGEDMVERDEDELSVAANTSRKKVNNLSGVGTWKPTSQYRAQTELPAPPRQKPLQRSTIAAIKINAHDVKENAGPVSVANGNGKPATDSQKLQSSSGLPIHVEDAALRTIYVNNVHTAATKDSLYHHFSKFGEVLKVVINTDPITGQPVGSAVIEFMGKEVADTALSVDGTSFMSRVIKVVKRSPPGRVQKLRGGTVTSQPHAGAVGVRSLGTMSYAAWYPPRSPFARGGGGVYRGGGGGTRSFQWKREDSTAAASAAISSSANSTTPPFPVARRFTYVRTQTKPNAT